MKTLNTILFLVIAFGTLSAQNNPTYMDLDKLFEYEVLHPKFANPKYKEFKQAYKNAQGNKSLGVVSTLGGPIIMLIGIGSIMGDAVEQTVYIFSEDKPKTGNGGTILLIGTVMTITGIVVISKSNRKKNDIKQQFLYHYNHPQPEKLESSIELKTKGAGLSLNYTF